MGLGCFSGAGVEVGREMNGQLRHSKGYPTVLIAKLPWYDQFSGDGVLVTHVNP
jgi:hypothetical protein